VLTKQVVVIGVHMQALPMQVPLWGAHMLGLELGLAAAVVSVCLWALCFVLCSAGVFSALFLLVLVQLDLWTWALPPCHPLRLAMGACQDCMWLWR
jgi:hypothetical protein